MQINRGLDWTTKIEAEEKVRCKWIEKIEEILRQGVKAKNTLAHLLQEDE